MSRQTLISLGILMVMFGSGVALGLFLAGGNSSSFADSKKASSTSSADFFPTTEGRERIEGNTLLSDRVRELEKELSEQNQQAILDDRLVFYKKHLNNFNISPFDENLKVTSVMADFLKLTPEEKRAVEEHLAQVQNELIKLEQAKISVVKQADKDVTYELPALPEGKALQTELNNLVTSDIGQDRANVFLGEAQWEISDLYFGFGEQKTQIEITEMDKNSGAPYMLKESFSNGASESRTISALPPQYQNLIQLDPPTSP